MRRRLLSGNKEIQTILPSQAEACDVVFANKQTEEVIIVRKWSVSLLSPKEWEPIGIVVIPGSHGVLKDDNGNNQCGIMSIVSMSCDNPNVGSNLNEYMYWGSTNTDISELKNYNKVVVTSNDTSNTAIGLSNVTGAYIPFQLSINDIIGRRSSPYAPSPYIGSDYKSGGYNEDYGTTKFDTSSDFNALADFDGPNNTKKIIQQRGKKDYSSWKPKYNTESDYPAASCCDIFSTIGTKQGDWYLPACGELCYILPRFRNINDIINKLYTAYNVGVTLYYSVDYWTSSEFSNKHARRVYTADGFLSNAVKNERNYVRAFLRLSDPAL